MSNNKTVAIALLVNNELPRVEHIVSQYTKFKEKPFFFIFDDHSLDGTKEELQNHGFSQIVNPFDTSNDFAYKRNTVMNYLNEFDWVLFVDADETWDPHFLKNLNNICKKIDRETLSVAFRRINLPTSKDYPDYQVRLIKLLPDELFWQGEVHEKLFSEEADAPVLDTVFWNKKRVNENKKNYCQISNYIITHLSRRTDLKRDWW